MPPSGLSFAAFAALSALGVLGGCFEVKYGDCRIICTPSEGCPADLSCIIPPGAATGLCAPAGTTCSPEPGVDAGMDAAMDAAADAGGPEAGAGDAAAPQTLCHNGACLTLPDAVRASLVLLLWPSNLPAAGSPVSVWTDQSGHGNDAHALYPTALPQVIPDGVHLDPGQLGSGFVVANTPSLDFGAGDFAVIVTAGLSSASAPVSFFRKSDSSRQATRQISLDWTLSSATAGRPTGSVDQTLVDTTAQLAQPSVGTYTLQRSGGHVELHFDGTVLGSADLPAADESTTNADDVYVGVAGLVGSPADSVEAVLALRGPVSSTDLAALEHFLRTVF
jgi:hypothetical protein